MSDAEDNTKTVDRESKDSKDKIKEDGDHLDNQVGAKTDDGKDDGGKNKDKVTPNKKNAKTKNQKKEEDDDEDEDDEEESDEDNDGDGKVPLLDQPLQITGTRDRKKTQRFTEEFKVLPRESPRNEIPEGRGKQLGEIPRIEANIQKLKTEKLKPLNRVLFKNPGKITTIRKNIRKFNGFDFKEGSEQYTRKRASITKMDMASLKNVSRILDLTTGGTREEIVTRILDFLMEPKESEKPLKVSKKKRSSSTGSSKKNAKRQNTSSGKGKKKKKDSDDEISSDEEDETEENDDKGSSEDEKESEEEEDEKEESDEESKKKKPAKKKPAANAKKPTPKKAEPKKETESKKVESKTAEKKKRKETEMKSDDESSSEDEPLVKKAKQPPTDDEIKSYVKQILEGANLEEITMKTVCKQVYAAYPEFDLAHKKDFIKTTVKSLIST